MTLAVLVELQPWDIGGAAPVILRACSHDDAALTTLNDVTWWPAISRLPKLSLRLFDGTFSGTLTPGVGDMELSLAAFPLASAYIWADRPAKIWIGQMGAAWGTYAQIFDGSVRTARFANGRIGLALRVNDDWMDGPLLTSAYAGTGGFEGEIDLKGVPKPICIGTPKYVTGRLIDPVNNVIQLHGYGTMRGLPAAMDKLSRFPDSIHDLGNYAALVAENIPAGKIATAVAIGMVRHGAPPEGILSYIVEGDNGTAAGWVRKPGAVIKRLTEIAGVPGAYIDAASLAALDAAVPYNLSRYFEEQTTPRAVIGEIAASCNASAGVSLMGKLFICRVGIGLGAPALTLRTDGTALPPVGDPEQLEVAPPFWRMQMKGTRTERVHNLNEVAYTATLVDLGDFLITTVYREGNIVFSPATGNRYLYINPVPAAGNPVAGTDFWTLLQSQDPAIAAALSAAEAAVAAAGDAIAIADGKIQSFYQDEPPVMADAGVGDLWIDTNDNNKLYRHGGLGLFIAGVEVTIAGVRIDMAWNVARDDGIAQALTDAAGAQATADGKVVTFFSETTPTAEAIGDLWFKQSLGIVYRWDGTGWAQYSSLGAPTGTNVAGRAASAVADAINADGTIAAAKVIASSFSADVINKIVSAQVSNVTASTTGAHLLTFASVPVKVSQGGYVHLILAANIFGQPNPAGANDSRTLNCWLQRSPAGAGVWTDIYNWTMYANVKVGVNVGGTTYYAGVYIAGSYSTQFVDQPPSDGSYDYRWLAGLLPPGAVAAPEDGPATVSRAFGFVVSAKLAA